MANLIYSILALATLGHSLPHPNNRPTATLPLNKVANTGSTALPPPSETPTYIALGLGTQNYTCDPSTSTYKASGALAQLFDATAYLNAQPNKISQLPTTFLRLYTSLSCSTHHSACIPIAQSCEDQANAKFPPRPLPILGEHYFNSAGIPSFDLYAAPGHPFLQSKKVGDVSAPDAQEDVDWLYLDSNGSPRNSVVTSVYRVETAGGVPPASCGEGDDGEVQVPYAAEYWFYA